MAASAIPNKAKKVLVFNNRKHLVSIMSSVTAASKVTKQTAGNIANACSGRIMSLNNHYFRYIGDNIEIEASDIGTLNLTEYDRLCGISRPVYSTDKMNRKNWKYKKTKNK